MSFRLYNTLSKEKEIFEPVVPGKVGIYVCGPTVYKDSHIGHAVGPVIFDALKKYLSYKGYQVKLVINITDVDDKLIIEAQRLGISIEDLARQVSANYFEAMEKLGVNSIDVYPRATDHIGHIIKLIQRLGENEAAYEVDGDVYFDITKCRDYGKLSHRRSEDQMEGTRDLAGAGKRNTSDFALWKKSADDEIGWDSPWGRGRPGWHIECSAMSMEYLGETFDIHGGGMDLIFPHHENEIAQTETATSKPFVKYWMHNGLTRIKTKQTSGDWSEEKMSKSLGNVRTLKELLAEYPPETIRFFLLSTHYRRPIDFSDEAIVATQKGMMTIYRLLERVARITDEDVYAHACDVAKMEQVAQSDDDKQLRDAVTGGQLRYLEALDDDFNTAGGIAVIFELCTRLNRYIDQQRLELQENPSAKALALEAARMISTLGKIIGLLEKPLEKADSGAGDELAGELMELLIELRRDAKTNKNYQLADTIRDRLKQLNIALEDRPDGTGWRKE
ncbi:MAG: cysteine--tRNA ligase [Sedimentisphaerales bacterium]|nr:cysteine--tRNA ligase [Sedimentisphaerales bacterium]